jgi:hypothetical protein
MVALTPAPVTGGGGVGTWAGAVASTKVGGGEEVGVGMLGASAASGGVTGAAMGGAGGKAASPARPVRPAGANMAVAVTGTIVAMITGKKVTSSTTVCSIRVLSSAIVSVMIVPMASTVVNRMVKPIVADYPKRTPP